MYGCLTLPSHHCFLCRAVGRVLFGTPALNEVNVVKPSEGEHFTGLNGGCRTGILHRISRRAYVGKALGLQPFSPTLTRGEEHGDAKKIMARSKAIRSSIVSLSREDRRVLVG